MLDKSDNTLFFVLYAIELVNVLPSLKYMICCLGRNASRLHKKFSTSDCYDEYSYAQIQKFGGSVRFFSQNCSSSP